MTAQEIFDKAAEGILRQGKKSISNNCCRYRADLTATCPIRCAAGYLIPDEKYSPIFDVASDHGGTGWPGPDDDEAENPLFEIANKVGHHWLVQELQSIHDSLSVEDWPHALKLLAEQSGLNYEVVRKYV